MGILVPSDDERVKSVRSESDTLSIDLMDSLSTEGLLHGSPAAKSQFLEAKS
jgi:hypothetical protein